MPKPLDQTLTPEAALIFRITHRANVRWILRNGLHRSRSPVLDPGFVTIGNPDLIGKRCDRHVPIPPGGTLDDYLPFYFTPYTPMLYNIKTGYGGIRQRDNEEIVTFVSSLSTLEAKGIRYLFTDRHAYLTSAQFFDSQDDLNRVDWGLLQRRDFQRDPEDPEKFERYQAEALVHRHLPVDGLLGLACYTDGVKRELDAGLSEIGVDLRTAVRPDWYFR